MCVTLWNAAHQASLSITNSRSPPKPVSIESVMPSNHLILCRPLLLLPLIFPSYQGLFKWVSSSHQVAKVWNFSISISSFNEYSGLILFRSDWFQSPSCPRDSQESSPAPQFKSINSSALSLLYGSTLMSSTRLLEKPQLWLFGPLSAKRCLCFIICCPGLS